MVKTSQFLRIIRLVQFIKACNQTNKIVGNTEITKYLMNIMADDAYNYSPATFSRDKNKMKEELGIDLKYSKSTGYYIDDSDNGFIMDSALDYYEMFALLNQANALPAIFIVSERKPKGLFQTKELVTHIKNKKVIQFRYLKYDTNENQIRKIEPLAIKESRERWYLIGNDFPRNTGLRAFALDRISEITTEGNNFSPKYSIDQIKQKYQDLFAMFDAEDQDVEEIVLQFDQRDGNYIKSFPIHHSQQVKEIENGVEVSLKLKTTPDFIMEIMSRAWSLKVIQPENLRLEIIQILKKSIERNQ